MAARRLRRAMLALMVVGLAAVSSTSTMAAPKPTTAAPAIVMYTTQTCGYCAKARQYLKARGLSWDERDIERSAQAQREWKTLGGAGTPLILVGEEKVNGFNQSRLEALLAKHGK